MTAPPREAQRALLEAAREVPGMMDYARPLDRYQPVPGTLGHLLNSEVRGRYRDLGGHTDALLDASQVLAARLVEWMSSTNREAPQTVVSAVAVAMAYARSVLPALVTPFVSKTARSWRDGRPDTPRIPLPVWERPLRAALTAMVEWPADVVLTDDELPRAASTDLFAADLLRGPLGLGTVVRAVVGHDLDDVPQDALLLGLGHSATAQATSVAAPELTVTSHDPLFEGETPSSTWPLVVAALGRPGQRAIMEALLDSDRLLFPDDVRALLATRDDDRRLIGDLRRAMEHVEEDGVLLAAVDNRAERVEGVVAAMTAASSWTRIRVAGVAPAVVLRHAAGVRTPTGFPHPPDLVLTAWRRG